jgi:predicted Ser/Thr protein kinase
METVECKTVLRSVPGARAVYDAAWQNRPVIIKVFSNRFNARRNAKKEWQGLNSLQKLKINSPSPLFYGNTDRKCWAVITEKITGSSTTIELFNSAGDTKRKFDLLSLVCRELAVQNEAGILQKDLHLGNFLVRDDRIFAIDPAQMRFYGRPLNKTESLSQLSFLAWCLSGDDGLIQSLGEQYFSCRRWKLEIADELLLKKKIASHRKKIIRKNLAKTLRTSSRYQKIRSGQYLAVFDRGFIGAADPELFLRQIDSLMDAGQIVKRDAVFFVSVIEWNGRKVAIKRYNHQGFFQSLCETIKGSGAKQSWLYGHSLQMSGAPVVKSLAFIELRKGLLLRQSYIITEFISSGD